MCNWNGTYMTLVNRYLSCRAANAFIPSTCEPDVVALLKVMRCNRAAGNAEEREAHFVAEQNTLVIKDAETYYRSMIRGGPES